MKGSVNVCLSKLAQDVCAKTIAALSNHYGFSASEAEALIGTLELSEKTKKMKKSKGEKKERAPREASIPLPFNGEIQEGCCQGLKQNHGLLTQCTNSPKESDAYCSTCQKQCDKNASGEPDNGTIAKRMQAYQDGVEFRDPKGRAPVPYAKVMQKLKLSKEQVLAEVEKSGRGFDESNFVAPESKRGRPKKEANLTTDTDSEGSKKRGRPKKAAKAVEVSSTEDLFATLISEVKAASPRPTAMAVQEAMSDLSGSESDGESSGSNSKTSKKSKMSDAEKSEKLQAKAQEKAEKEAAKAQEKAEKDAAKANEKAEKEAAKAQEKADKDAAKAQEKAEKEAAKKAEKEAQQAAKLQEKAEKDAAKKAEKEAQQAAKKDGKGKPEAQKAAVAAAPVEAEEEPKVLSVKVFNFNGVAYLRTADNVLYNKETKECAGVFNEERQEIDECELEEESEEESDEDEDDE